MAVLTEAESENKVVVYCRTCLYDISKIKGNVAAASQLSCV